jgi:acetolactate synthase-1/2/3 large subunit
VAHNQLPIKLFLLNNNGYQSIRITQTNLFDANYAGIDPATGVGMPSWQKVAAAFELHYTRIEDAHAMGETIDAFLATPGPGICEVVCDTEQVWEPKLAARRLPDGRMESPALEDMSPFLPREELAEVMSIMDELPSAEGWHE